jgi:cell division protein FtsB
VNGRLAAGTGPRRARLALAAGGLLVGVVLGTWGVTGALRVHALHREIERAERDIAALRARAAALTETIDRLRHDPDYLEKLAREEHGLVREGETVLKFPSRPR